MSIFIYVPRPKPVAPVTDHVTAKVAFSSP